MGNITQHFILGPANFTLVVTEPPCTTKERKALYPFIMAKSKKFLLHRKVVCWGPRSSKTFRTFLVDEHENQSPLHHVEFQMEMTHTEVEAFQQLVEFMYHGTPIPNTNDPTMMTLAKRFEINISQRSPRSDELVQRNKTTGNPRQHKIQPTKILTASIPSTKKQTARSDAAVQNKKNAWKPLQHKMQPTKKQTESMKAVEALKTMCRQLKTAANEADRNRLRINLKKALESTEIDVSDVTTNGCINCLLELLSDNDAYQGLANPTVRLITRIAKTSELHATRLVDALVVDQLLFCQVIHSNGVRMEALVAIGAIAQHSEKLCNEVVDRRDCLKCFEMALSSENDDMTMAALPAVHAFSRFAPVKMSSPKLIDGVTTAFRWLSCASQPTAGRLQRCKCAMESLGNFALALQNGQAKAELESAMCGMCCRLTYPHLAPALCPLLSQLIRKPYLLSACLERRCETIMEALWSPDRGIQFSACFFVANTTFELLRNKNREYTKWINSELLPLLVTMLNFRGNISHNAAIAISSILRLKGEGTARVFVECNGVSKLCDFLLTGSTVATSRKGHAQFKTTILLALQSVLSVETSTETTNMVVTSLGLVMKA